MTFEQLLQKYRDISFSERDKGYRFERLMQSFLKTYPKYINLFTSIWLWNEFPSRADFGAGDKDLGIDLVARTKNGDYWAIQCKCYKEDASIDKPKVDTFLSTSGKTFYDTKEAGKKVNFAFRLWIDTTKKGFNNEAEASIKNQTPEVGRIGYLDLVNAFVDWEKIDEGLSGKNASKEKYDPKPHQKTAISKVHNYFKTNDRGKLIMACGTGKTFTSLRIAENETKDDGLILLLVPSIALLGQTLREWTDQCRKPIHPICICSDIGVVKKATSVSGDDTSQDTITDLALPASTNVPNITHQFERAKIFQNTEGGNIVVFSTYQSIDKISEVQKAINRRKKGSFIFDLIICDEAHRTTGVTLADKNESAFVKVHDNDFLKASKRIYMTATPRIYSEDAQKKAKEASAELCSMDDKTMYGEEMYRIGFGEAVDKDLLSDYKVIVLTIEEGQLKKELEKSIKDKKERENKEYDVEETHKIIGCINALSKKSLYDKEIFSDVDPAPMRSAVAFCQNIKVSKQTAENFNIYWEAYYNTLDEKERSEIVHIQASHVDGTMGAQVREKELHWLKSADAAKHECNILHNVRCLSEGVDVPSLDAVMFLSARNSQIDVVQSVGRVMRKSNEKKYGYIIIPVVIAPQADPDKILNSDRFKVVWTVLNALRAHDDRFNALINKIDLNKKKSGKINVTGTGGFGEDDDSDSGAPFDREQEKERERQRKKELVNQLELEFAKLQGLIYAKIVKKCGQKLYWEQWACDVAKIAESHIKSIAAIIKKEGKAKQEFERYISGLRKNINPSVTKQEAIEMLAQHIITQPVFEALFEDYSFVNNNTVSKSLQGIISALNEQEKKSDAEKLKTFYVSVQERAKDIDNSEAKQRIIIELYDKFFRTAFPKVTEKLGIVYTSVEVVDFIIHSVEDILQKEFGRSMTDENVHILDPFTGTGTFITRLLQSGIIKNEDLKRKYTKEIHANEIILLAYYIASINIENVYHDIVGSREWGIGSREEKTGSGGDYEGVYGIEGMAGSNESGRNYLSDNEKISTGGTIWADQPDSAGSSINPGKYSGRKREAVQKGVPSFPDHSKRFPLRTGNINDNSGTNSIYSTRRTENNTESNGYSRTYDDGSSEVAEASIENKEWGMGSGEKRTCKPQSPLPIPYSPFPGICLTDTFQLGETLEGENLFSEIFPQNSERVQEQQKTPLRVIMSNPPYSIGQKSANDNAQNQGYPKLENRIAETYVAASQANLNKAAYDTYIKAFRWASDRLDPENGGVIGFVSNGSWLDSNGLDGFRKCLEQEFSSIYVYNLRGNQRTSGELSRKEGGKIFGSGSRTPVTITILVKRGKNG